MSDNWFRETPESLQMLAEERALVEEAERQEELTLALGQVRCESRHGWRIRSGWPCPKCGAAL